MTTPTTAPRPGRSPLPPHRLAKLADALGVATPTPASYHSAPTTSYIYPTSSHAERFQRRSPTPSSSTFTSTTPSTPSKYLLHVIPPIHLPHDSDFSSPDEFALSPPTPTSTMSYTTHDQFRRGSLVPLHPTLQSQLVAIAKEYALPSTGGMVLYLATSGSSPGSLGVHTMLDEPGPRLSEEIWKMIWSRAIASEREDATSITSRGPTPAPLGQGYSLGNDISTSTFSSQEPRTVKRSFSSSRPKEPLQTRPNPYPITPSSSSPSSSLRYKPKSQSSKDISEPDTPSTSFDEHELREIPLPGLISSSSFIPILAKVEFDIDRRKAGWYEPWARSRRMVRARRGGQQSEGDERGKALMELALVEKLKAKPFADYTADVGKSEAEGYAPLTESPEPADFEKGDENVIEMQKNLYDDPLADVFGTDEDTWAEMHAESRLSRPEKASDPHIVDLALNAASLALAEDPLNVGDTQEDTTHVEEMEVTSLWKVNDRPRLSVSIPPSSPTSSTPKKRRPTLSVAKRHVPSSLTLHANPSKILVSEADRLGTGTLEPAISSANSVTLPYLENDPGEDSKAARLAIKKARRKTTVEAKKPGAIFDEILKLDLGNDDDDVHPDVRRSSQYLMKKQLDEIERNLNQFSPRDLHFPDNGNGNEGAGGSKSASSSSPATTPIISAPPRRSSVRPVAPKRMPGSELWPPPPTPDWVRVKEAPPLSSGSVSMNESEKDAESSPSDSVERPSRTSSFAPRPRTSSGAVPQWPATPFATLPYENGTDAGPPAGSTGAKYSRVRSISGGGNVPPKLMINGISNDPPKSPYSQRNPVSFNVALSAESQTRTSGLEGQNAQYPPHLSSPSFPRRARGPESPIIPLSPDPFGRTPTEWETSRLTEERRTGLLAEVAKMTAPNMSPNQFPSPMSPSLYSKQAPGQRKLSVSKVRPDLQHERGDSRGQQNRFPVDSAVMEDSKKSTLVSVKSIKRLWRKSSNKSLSGIPPMPPTPISDSGRSTSPPPPVPDPVRLSSRAAGSQTHSSPETVSAAPRPPFSTERSASLSNSDDIPEGLPGPSVSRQSSLHSSYPSHDPSPPLVVSGRRPSSSKGSAYPPPAVMVQKSTKHSRSSSGMDPFHFDQDSKYPVPQTTPEPIPSPSIPLIPQAVTSSPPTPPLGRRKSILKSWKSSGGSVSAIADTSEAYPGPIPESPRRRRPSVVESVRKSLVAGADIPPSPEIPDHYSHLKTNRQQFPSNGLPERRMSVQRKLSPQFAPSSSIVSNLGSDGSSPLPSENSFHSSQFETVTQP